MRILVTGGLGAVGSHLVPELRRRGHDVVTLDLLHHHGSQHVRCDVSKSRQLEAVWRGGGWEPGYSATPREFDLVYHLAAEFGRWNGEDYYENLWETNAVGTKNLLRMQEREGFRAVYFSSSEVYGDWIEQMSEDVMDRHEIRQLNDYAISKWVNELQVLNSAEQHGTESVRIRLFNTYGPGEEYSPYRSVICLFAYRALHGMPFTVYRGHKRTSTYLSDCAQALANLTVKFVPGEAYNIGGSDYHDIETVAEIVLRLSGQPADLVLYKDSEPFTTTDKLVDVTKAARDLGMRTTVSLEDGIERTLAWMKERYDKGEVQGSF